MSCKRTPLLPPRTGSKRKKNMKRTIERPASGLV
jgi:hypothetical protein